MNAAGQVLVEYILLAALFMLFIGMISKQIPLTFKDATPYLGGKVELRLETGQGFANAQKGNAWNPPVKSKGGVGGS